MSQQISITLKAYDEASKTIAEASSKINGSLDQVERGAKGVAGSQRDTQKSTKDLVTGFSGVATAGFSLYNAYDRVADMQVSVDRANLQVKSSTNSVGDAERRVAAASDALAKAHETSVEVTLEYGAGSDRASEAIAREESASRSYEAAQADLALAQERHNTLPPNQRHVLRNATLRPQKHQKHAPIRPT